MSHQLATMDYVRATAVPGEVVSIPVRLTMSEQHEKWDGEPYLILDGVDMTGRQIGALRMWGLAKNEMPVGLCVGCCCILRGLIVSLEKEWSSEHQKYVAKEPHANVVEKWAGTAVEMLDESCAG